MVNLPRHYQLHSGYFFLFISVFFFSREATLVFKRDGFDLDVVGVDVMERLLSDGCKTHDIAISCTC